MNLFAIFLTGLTTGGLTCLAMQGGLLASAIANQKEDELDTLDASAHSKTALKKLEKNLEKTSFDQLDWLPVVMFVSAKLISHTILGFVLGLVGSIFTLNLGFRLAFQIFSALFMFATAMNLLNVHPIFRYVVIQPPKFIQRLLRGTTKSRALFTPAILGFLTIFVPCGVTQAMAVLAINTGNPVYGALIMFAFILGTAPLFTMLGIATAKLSEFWNQRFLRFAAVALMLMAIYGFNGVLTVLDAPFSLQRVEQAIASLGEPPDWYGGTSAGSQAAIVGDKQQVKLSITNKGYSPRELTVRAGTPVELTLETNGVYSCASSFTFRKFNIFEQLKPSDSKVVAFTPTEKGDFQFSCSMGMYTGVVHVI